MESVIDTAKEFLNDWQINYEEKIEYSCNFESWQYKKIELPKLDNFNVMKLRQEDYMNDVISTLKSYEKLTDTTLIFQLSEKLENFITKDEIIHSHDMVTESLVRTEMSKFNISGKVNLNREFLDIGLSRIYYF